MLRVLTISPQSLAHPPSSPTLTTLAGEHELVLVCDYDAAPSLIRAVRTLLPRHRLVAMLVDPDLLRHEHELLEEILDDGHLPVILSTGEPTAVQLSLWLNADTDLTDPPLAACTQVGAPATGPDPGLADHRFPSGRPAAAHGPPSLERTAPIA